MKRSINASKLASTLIEYYNEEYTIKILVKWCSISITEAKEFVRLAKK